MSDADFKDWNLEQCNKWLNDPYNQPDPLLDDTFDRAFRGAVRRQRDTLIKQCKKMELENRKIYLEYCKENGIYPDDPTGHN